jgi:hypothetical protein
MWVVFLKDKSGNLIEKSQDGGNCAVPLIIPEIHPKIACIIHLKTL